MKRWTVFVAVALAAATVVSFTTLAAAQLGEQRQAAFESAAKIKTSVGGVEIFAGPPKGFNPLTATNEELWRYGLPESPDQQANPVAYKGWARAMTSLRYRAVDVKAAPYHSSPAKLINQPANAVATVSNGPTTYGSTNWSGVANTNTLKKWNTITSFNSVESAFVVPSAYPPTGACSNGIKGPFITSIWSGIDGFSSGDVVQGGVTLYSDCGGAKDNEYVGWIEWYPSYAELDILCTKTTACPITPGDTVFVETFGVAGTATQSVFVENVSQGWSGTFTLPWVSGPGLIGSSEEQIVERPCCVEVSGVEEAYALNNYDFAYFASAFGTDVKGTQFYVGEQSVATAILDMYDDAGTEAISEPAEQGSSGNAGKYMLWVGDYNCASTGGCTP